MNRSAIVVLIATLLALAWPSGAMGKQSNLSDELILDLTTTAQIRDVTFEQALADFYAREAASPVVEAVANDADHFGGAYSDYSSGIFELHVLYVAADARDQLRRIVPAGVPVIWELVARTQGQLKAIQEQIVSDWQKNAEEIEITGVRTDLINNQVVISVNEPNEDLEAFYEAQFGDAVRTVIAPPSSPVSDCTDTQDPEGGSRYACTPFRGGIELQKTGNDHTGHCTMTMWAKGQSNPANRFIISAGHCASYGNWTFCHNGDVVGTSSAAMDSLNDSNPKSDSRKVPAADNTTQMNRVYETPSSKSYVISSKRPVINQALGDWVCKIGTGTGTSGGLPTFGRQCGQIYDIDSPFIMNGHTIYGKAADFNGTAYGGQGVSGGDSGASVVYNGQLYGLADTTTGQYSLWNAIEDDLNVSFCMTANCS